MLKTCLYCKKSFIVYGKKIKKRKHCSKLCWLAKEREKKLILLCQWCDQLTPVLKKLKDVKGFACVHCGRYNQMLSSRLYKRLLFNS